MSTEEFLQQVRLDYYRELSEKQQDDKIQDLEAELLFLQQTMRVISDDLLISVEQDDKIQDLERENLFLHQTIRDISDELNRALPPDWRKYF